MMSQTSYCKTSLSQYKLFVCFGTFCIISSNLVLKISAAESVLAPNDNKDNCFPEEGSLDECSINAKNGQSSLHYFSSYFYSAYKEQADASSQTCRSEESLSINANTRSTQEKKSDQMPEFVRLLHSGMKGLEALLEKMPTKMAETRQKIKEGFDSRFVKVMQESQARMQESFGTMMDTMSESRHKMEQGLDAVVDLLVTTKRQMLEGLDNVMDQVAHSNMVDEIDQVLEYISQSRVLMELRSLPQEIRASFILSARNRSYIAAGILVAISAAILFGGAVYYAWCHHDAWSYYIGTIEEARSLLRQAKESGFIRSSRSSSVQEDKWDDDGDDDGDDGVEAKFAVQEFDQNHSEGKGCTAADEEKKSAVTVDNQPLCPSNGAIVDEGCCSQTDLHQTQGFVNCQESQISFDQQPTGTKSCSSLLKERGNDAIDEEVDDDDVFDDKVEYRHTGHCRLSSAR